MSLLTRLKNAILPRTMQAGAYEATSTARRVEDWGSTGYGPNAALDHAPIGRARSQDAARNNPWIRRAIRLLVSHEIGCGIQPRPTIADPGLRNEVLTLWNRWVQEADADGVLDFYAQQALLARARYESGEVFVRLRTRRPEDGLSVPLQLQLIEADLLPTYFNQALIGPNIRQGIERNAIGQRVAYWFYREHPGDLSGVALLNDLSRVPASEILHHYQPQRPGQLRGEPSTLSTLLRARNLDQFESAELTRKKIKARFAGVIYKENIEDAPLMAEGSTNLILDDLKNQLAAALHANDSPLAASLREQIAVEQERKSIVDVEEGYMLQLALHERADLAGGDTGSNSGLDFIRTQLRSIAAGLGVPYELMTGDYSSTNDRIMRVILNTFYRELEICQDLLIAQVLQPLYKRWLTSAVLSKALRLPGYLNDPTPWQRCQWRAHAWSYVNPLQEAQTAVLKIDNGLTSRSAAVAETGWDVEDVDRDQAADHAREEALDLHYGTKAPLPAETAETVEPAAPPPEPADPAPDPVLAALTAQTNALLALTQTLALRASNEPPPPIQLHMEPGETHIHMRSSKTTKTPIRDENGLITAIIEQQDFSDG